jgi:hypothetical protein
VTASASPTASARAVARFAGGLDARQVRIRVKFGKSTDAPKFDGQDEGMS